MSKVVALFPAHPAQLWLMLSVKSWIQEVDQSVQFKWFFRDKDVTLSLASSLGLEGVVVSKASSGLFGNAVELTVNIFRCVYYTKKYGIDLWLTKYGCGNIAAKILNKKSISFNDDDEDVVPLIAKTSYPFADLLLFPKFTRNIKFYKKSIYYNGLHESAYLTNDRAKSEAPHNNSESRYALVRISALKSHHDVGRSGISLEFLDKLVDELEERNISVYISSESRLPPRFSSMVRNADVSEIHEFLAGACFYVGDSQTMAIEASLLSVPTLRISDFDNLSVINYLEKQGLIISFPPDDTSSLSYLASFLDNYEQRYASFSQQVRRVRNSFDDTREVFGQAVLKLLQG
ncbi:hypothetical protein [Marinobacter sp. SS13-12]|uniref:hypothetical protein n=1 Tax=Marinobacter sp. SS13-12 TaxID=3050451 RepID=UPI002552B1D6|nr:hypothetical protein [Marinobacter sp. SS13-12]MDK8463824.1 hypothetical protein [Marinobacter sp. SS13-12]